MKWMPQCSVCFFQQMLALGKKLGFDDNFLKDFLKQVAVLFSNIRSDASPPEFAIEAYGLVEKITGIKDPYEEEKRISNEFAMRAAGRIKSKLIDGSNELLTALFLAIAGNIIDYGVRHNVDVAGEIESILRAEDNVRRGPLFEVEGFLEDLYAAKSVLYIGDNCGEIVFDKIFIEEILKRYPDKKIIFAVRGGPIINDVTREDAVFVGLDKLCRIITTGLRSPGVVLGKASDEFLRYYHSVDMVISKGQGNFEAMSPPGRKVYFLFMAKCQVVADFIGCEKNSILLLGYGE